MNTTYKSPNTALARTKASVYIPVEKVSKLAILLKKNLADEARQFLDEWHDHFYNQWRSNHKSNRFDIALAEYFGEVMRHVSRRDVTMSQALFNEMWYCKVLAICESEILSGNNDMVVVGWGPEILRDKTATIDFSVATRYTKKPTYVRLITAVHFMFDGDDSVGLPAGKYFRFHDGLRDDDGYLLYQGGDGLLSFNAELCPLAGNHYPRGHERLHERFRTVWVDELTNKV